jgi:hypothetical protein
MNKKNKSLILIFVLLGMVMLTVFLTKQRQEVRRGATGFAMATVLLNPESVEVKKGDKFDVDLMVNTEATLSASSLFFCFDEDKLALDSEDDLLPWSSESGYKFSIILNNDIEDNDNLKCFKVDLIGNTNEGNLPSGFFRFLRIKMRAIAEGEAIFKLLMDDSILIGINKESNNKIVDMVSEDNIVNVKIASQEDSLLLMSYDVSSKTLKADEEMSLSFFADTVGEKILGDFNFEICVHNSMDFVKKIDRDCDYVVEKDSLYHRDLNCFKISGNCKNKSGKLKIADLYFKPNVSKTDAPFIINDETWVFDGFSPQWVSGYDNVFSVVVGGGLNYKRCNVCEKKSLGDANCDGKITMVDFEIWRNEYFDIKDDNYDWKANFSCTDELKKPSMVDFNIWRKSYFGI